MSTLEDATVIITGASRGIGAALSKRIACEGGNVILTARNRRNLEAVAAETSGNTLVHPADVTDEQEVRGTVEAAIEEYGNVSGLVNNAGIGLLSLYDELRPLHEVNADDFRRIMDVNVTGVFLFAKYVSRVMIDAGRGDIINVSSGLGHHVKAGWGPYTTSKWAVEGLTGTQADELDEYSINVNAIFPGGRVNTGFWNHLPQEERAEILDPNVMNDAVVKLLGQAMDGISGESLSATEWNNRL